MLTPAEDMMSSAARFLIGDFYKSWQNICMRQKIHFIGIGGIGVSALARFYLHSGTGVSGSDLVSSEITEELKRIGVNIVIGKHARTNIPKGTNLAIYTSATSKDNPERLEAKKRKIKTLSYAEALGEITKKYKTITVSGSHGKSTTTAMAALVLEEGYFDPTVIIGTKLKEFGGSNFRAGKGSYLMLEADEWNKSFLKYSPYIAIVTIIDAEHLDTYKSLKGAQKVFAMFLKKVPKGGMIIANKDNKPLFEVAKKFKKNVIWYSLDDPEAQKIRSLLRVPGEHNISNALAAYRLGKLLGMPESAILKALGRFSGTWRRFDIRGSFQGATIIDDYGHQPTEIKATIKAAREKYPFRRIWCVYQPHQYQRLAYLWKDFIQAFDMADTICLLPVYDVAGRETKASKTKVNSEKLSHELLKRGKQSFHCNSFAEAKKLLSSRIKKDDIVLMMGAGDIYK